MYAYSDDYLLFSADDGRILDIPQLVDMQSQSVEEDMQSDMQIEETLPVITPQMISRRLHGYHTNFILSEVELRAMIREDHLAWPVLHGNYTIELRDTAPIISQLLGRDDPCVVTDGNEIGLNKIFKVYDICSIIFADLHDRRLHACMFVCKQWANICNQVMIRRVSKATSHKYAAAYAIHQARKMKKWKDKFDIVKFAVLEDIRNCRHHLMVWASDNLASVEAADAYEDMVGNQSGCSGDTDLSCYAEDDMSETGENDEIYYDAETGMYRMKDWVIDG